MIRTFLLSSAFILYYSSILSSQNPTSAVIYENIKKLNVLGSVLYIAAHPDDENTRLITYLSKNEHLRTAYVSLTRGDGGQNLIGSELDAYLGVIRTQELAEARKIDGGHQFFTRANDFGYSKNAEETFAIWNREEILIDLIKVIREFKPDVIINRFDHRTSGKTHGHHTASAILGLEAFQKSNSQLFHQEKMIGYEPHIVDRIFFNTSWFFWGSREKFDQADKSHLHSLDIGSYYPAYGLSNNEISAQSRSMHKSQGFGINSSRGSILEYFERIDQPTTKGNLLSPFDGLDFTWNRLNGGGNIRKVIDNIVDHYDYQKPWLSIPELQKAEQYIKDLEPGYWRDAKLNEIQQVIMDCAGIFTEAHTSAISLSPGQMSNIQTECMVRNPVEVKLLSIRFPMSNIDSTFQMKLDINKAYFWNRNVSIPLAEQYTTPFWLWNGRDNGFYNVDNQAWSNRVSTPNPFVAEFHLQINSTDYTLSNEIIYKNDDPVKGEIRQPVMIVPLVTLAPEDYLCIMKPGEKKKLKIVIEAHADLQQGTVELSGSDLLQIIPAFQKYDIKKMNGRQEIEFELSSMKFSNSPIVLTVKLNGKKAYIKKKIEYDHIPWQQVLLPAELKVIHTDLKTISKRIAYVEGAGDYIDEALRKLGHSVMTIPSENLSTVSIKNTDVVVFGIRALNTQQNLINCKETLLQFMNEGGKVIFQYNTTAELLTNDFAPLPLKISRDRVTDENAKVTITQPQHRILNKPNIITEKDFENWVQERGLYFPNPIDSMYEVVVSMADPGDKPLNSGIVYTKVGKGHFIYTPLAWFRQLPAGVPGAYRLMSNLISF